MEIIPVISNDSVVLEAVMTLEPKYRIPIILHYVEQYTIKEAATLLYLPEGTLKSRLKKAREQLRFELSEEEVLV